MLARLIRLLPLFLAACVTAAGGEVTRNEARHAVTQHIAGPRLGYLFHRAQGIRPLFGVPGAAVIGPALALDAGILEAEAMPQRNYAARRVSSVIGASGDRYAGPD